MRSKWFATADTPEPVIPSRRLRILAVSIPSEDLFLLEYMAGRQQWQLRSTRSAREAVALASRGGFDMIFCYRNQPEHPWREVMDRLADSSPESCIFLVAPITDDYLWWDVICHRGSTF